MTKAIRKAGYGLINNRQNKSFLADLHNLKFDVMECPNCGKEIEIDPVVFANCERYGAINLATSKCCGAGFLVKPITRFQITPYTGEQTEDEWGNPISKPPLPAT